MEVVDLIPDGQYINLQETFEEVDEDDDGLFQEDILITCEETIRENVLHATDDDEKEDLVDADMSDQELDLAGSADDY